MSEKRFIYTFKKGTMVIIDKKDNVLIRDKYRACDYLNRLNNENEQLKQIPSKLDIRIKKLQDDLNKLSEMNTNDLNPQAVENVSTMLSISLNSLLEFRKELKE